MAARLTADPDDPEPRRSGGIGRRASLRSWCPKGRGGSSPPSDTVWCPETSEPPEPSVPGVSQCWGWWLGADFCFLCLKCSAGRQPIAISATARLDPPSPNACHHHILCPRIATPRSTATAAYCEPTTLTAARLPPLTARTNRITAAIPNMPATKEVMKALRSLGKIRGPVERATEIAIRNARERWSNRGKPPASPPM